ncbi:type I-C CRISPR-associated endonuclease Cas1c [Parathermosynechococcus lividus]
MKPILNTLFVQTQGTYLRLDHETLKLEVEKEVKFQVPLHHLGGIVLFGNVLVSPYLIHKCAEDGRGVVWLTEHGRFKGRLVGSTTGNVLLRQALYEATSSQLKSLAVAQHLVAAKLQNARNVLLRAARETTNMAERQSLQAAGKNHADSLTKVSQAESIDFLRGIEGIAAKAYFSVFGLMVRQQRGLFTFTGRSKHPPRDPLNALLSLAYTLLTNDYVGACESVGLDPQMGFLHSLRPGKPSLALDLVEELRPIFADRLVLTLINRQQIKPEDFIERPGGTIYLNDEGRKTFLAAYQKRKQEEVMHPILEQRIPWGLIPHVQARLLARYLRGDVSSYQPFILRG